MAKSAAMPHDEQIMSLPQGDVQIYIAPGMQTATFNELLLNAGVPRDQADWMQEVDAHIAELQRQIDELRGGTPPADPALAERDHARRRK